MKQRKYQDLTLRGLSVLALTIPTEDVDSVNTWVERLDSLNIAMSKETKAFIAQTSPVDRMNEKAVIVYPNPEAFRPSSISEQELMLIATQARLVDTTIQSMCLLRAHFQTQQLRMLGLTSVSALMAHPLHRRCALTLFEKKGRPCLEVVEKLPLMAKGVGIMFDASTAI